MINESDQDVGGELLIDRLNSLTFSDKYHHVGKWMIAAHSSGVVKGWHRSHYKCNQFLVAPTPESALARLGKPTSSIGTITAIFYPAWSGDNRPPLEQLLVSERSRSGTARGQLISTRFKETKREFGKAALAVISVRYENPKPPEVASSY